MRDAQVFRDLVHEMVEFVDRSIVVVLGLEAYQRMRSVALLVMRGVSLDTHAVVRVKEWLKLSQCLIWVECHLILHD